MSYSVDDPRVKDYAKMFGVPLEKLAMFEQQLLTIPYITNVDFDASALEGKVLCMVVKYEISVGDPCYYVNRAQARKAVVRVANENGLVRTGDPIEDYGEHFYYVFDAKAWF